MRTRVLGSLSSERYCRASSPLNKDSRVKSHIGKASGFVNASSNTSSTINAKKRLAVPLQGFRPHTSPEVVSVKNQVAANRTPGRLRKANSKYKAGNATQTNANFVTEIVPGEKLKVVVQEDNDHHESIAELLIVSGPRAGTDDMLSEEAWLVSALRQGDGELRNIRSSSADKQSKEPSPPSRNNRYGNGIKTRLAKLFNKGNACMEEPKVMEPQRNHIPYNLSLATSGNHSPARYTVFNNEESILIQCLL